MLDVGDGLFEQLSHVVVMQVIDNLAPVTAAYDKAQMTKHA
jgi:hypothetical protein